VESVIRLLPYAVADGPHNMAADEALVHAATEGIASLRFYGWAEATVSLGYFQPAAVRLSDSFLANLPWVRRPSGGAALVHHHELTYALALPCGPPWRAGEPWMPRMHRIIAAALSHTLPADAIAPFCERLIRHGDVLCFQQHTPGDLVSRGYKVVGSAQRKYRQALLQHGAILLTQSEHAPALPGIRETTGATLTAEQVRGAIVAAFAAETGWRVQAADWTESEKALIADLTCARYASAAWNERR
jgi:lipoyl(octanoyl) transferase